MLLVREILDAKRLGGETTLGVESEAARSLERESSLVSMARGR